MIKKAIELRRQGKDQEALTELQSAAAIANPPKLSAQIGFAEQALGLWVAADKHLREALDQAKDPWIKKNHKTLEDSLDAVGNHLANLNLWGDPEGAEVLVDGDRVGTLPLSAPLRVSTESVELTVRSKGFVTSTRKLELSPGSNVREHVVLRAVVIIPQSPVPPVPPAAVQAPGATPTTATPGPAKEESPSIFT